MKSDLTDIEVVIHHETEAAVLVSLDGHRDGAVWVPKSQVEIFPSRGGTATITLPEWLAIEKGLC